MFGRRTRFWAGLLADIGEDGFVNGVDGGEEQGVRITGTNSVTDLLRDNKISMTKHKRSTALVVNSPYDKTFIVLTVKTSPLLALLPRNVYSSMPFGRTPFKTKSRGVVQFISSGVFIHSLASGRTFCFKRA